MTYDEVVKDGVYRVGTTLEGKAVLGKVIKIRPRYYTSPFLVFRKDTGGKRWMPLHRLRPVRRKP